MSWKWDVSGTAPDEEHVMQVAGKWSINPNMLEELELPKGVGWIGNIIRATN